MWGFKPRSQKPGQKQQGERPDPTSQIFFRKQDIVGGFGGGLESKFPMPPQPHLSNEERGMFSLSPEEQQLADKYSESKASEAKYRQYRKYAEVKRVLQERAELVRSSHAVLLASAKRQLIEFGVASGWDRDDYIRNSMDFSSADPIFILSYYIHRHREFVSKGIDTTYPNIDFLHSQRSYIHRTAEEYRQVQRITEAYSKYSFIEMDPRYNPPFMSRSEGFRENRRKLENAANYRKQVEEDAGREMERQSEWRIRQYAKMSEHPLADLMLIRSTQLIEERREEADVHRNNLIWAEETYRSVGLTSEADRVLLKLGMTKKGELEMERRGEEALQKISQLAMESAVEYEREGKWTLAGHHYLHAGMKDAAKNMFGRAGEQNTFDKYGGENAGYEKLMTDFFYPVPGVLDRSDPHSLWNENAKIDGRMLDYLIWICPQIYVKTRAKLLHSGVYATLITNPWVRINWREFKTLDELREDVKKAIFTSQGGEYPEGTYIHYYALVNDVCSFGSRPSMSEKDVDRSLDSLELKFREIINWVITKDEKGINDELMEVWWRLRNITTDSLTENSSIIRMMRRAREMYARGLYPGQVYEELGFWEDAAQWYLVGGMHRDADRVALKIAEKYGADGKTGENAIRSYTYAAAIYLCLDRQKDAEAVIGKLAKAHEEAELWTSAYMGYVKAGRLMEARALASKMSLKTKIDYTFVGGEAGIDEIYYLLEATRLHVSRGNFQEALGICQRLGWEERVIRDIREYIRTREAINRPTSGGTRGFSIG